MIKSEIDAIILSVCRQDWLKTARVIVEAAALYEGKGKRIAEDNSSYDLVAEQLYTLVLAGTIECHGNIEKWRFSEVRLAATS